MSPMNPGLYLLTYTDLTHFSLSQHPVYFFIHLKIYFVYKYVPRTLLRAVDTAVNQIDKKCVPSGS